MKTTITLPCYEEDFLCFALLIRKNVQWLLPCGTFAAETYSLWEAGELKLSHKITVILHVYLIDSNAE